MDDDALDSLLFGDKPKAAPAPKAPARSSRMDPTEALVRTVYGETAPDAPPEEQQWIAATALNRLKKAGKGKDFTDIVFEGNGSQYNVWKPGTKARARAEALKMDSPEYQRVAANIADVIAGNDPSGGVINYYHPDTQAKNGDAPPKWDDGTGQRIGGALFFGGKAPAISGNDADLDAALFGEGKPAKIEPGTGAVINAKTGAPSTKPQEVYFLTRAKEGTIDPNATPGSAKLPRLQIEPGTEPDGPGVYYVTLDGQLKQTADKRRDAKNALGEGDYGKAAKLYGEWGLGEAGALSNRFLSGALMGGKNEAIAGMNAALSGRDFKPEFARNLAALDKFDAEQRRDYPIGSAVGAAAGAISTSLLAPEVAGAKLLTRGAVAGATGAAMGGAQGFLGETAPMDERLKNAAEGAKWGAILGPAAEGASAAGGKLFNSLVGAEKAVGGAPAAEQQLRFAMANDLPVPVPMTRGQISGSPVQQLAENAAFTGADGETAASIHRAFQAEQQAALRGNVTELGSRMVGGKSVARGDASTAVSEKLGTMRDAAKKEIDAAYKQARESADGAYLPSEERPVFTARLREAVRDYDPETIAPVTRELARLDGTGGTLTPRDLFEARTRIGNLTQSNDLVAAGAARKAVRELDNYLDEAVTRDLISGDPNVVQAWRTAIGKRREFGKLFEGNDMIETLTAMEPRGGQMQLVVDPEKAADTIFGRSSLGFVGKKNLTRDLRRMRDVLGPESDEWNGLRSEVFQRIARAGEGAPEAGQPQFSGQNFFKAWNKVKAEDPQIVRTMFTSEERELIDRFAEVAQRVTTPVRGGHNPSGTGVMMKKFVEQWMPILTQGGYAGGGAMMGGPVGAVGGAMFGAFTKAFREALKANKARASTYGAKPAAKDKAQRLLPTSGAAAALLSNRLVNPPQGPGWAPERPGP